MAYDGIISYSHAADGRLAPALGRGLEQMAKRWNSRRAPRVFRDETGRSTNPHLWSAIERALDESAWFLLLASPEAAASEWVNKEVEHWLAAKSVERLLPVVTDGTWEVGG
jgi:TIR domain